VKLFQIEEPDGSPVDPDMPGAAIGVDLGGAQAAVAVAVGGNAAILHDREGFESELPVPALDASIEAWQLLLEGARLRAERALAQPVTHAVLAMASTPAPSSAARLIAAGETAGLSVLRIVGRDVIPAGETPVIAAAILAEDLAPRPAAH
jgi:hypothetical protein